MRRRATSSTVLIEMSLPLEGDGIVLVLLTRICRFDSFWTLGLFGLWRSRARVAGQFLAPRDLVRRRREGVGKSSEESRAGDRYRQNDVGILPVEIQAGECRHMLVDPIVHADSA